jgi:hypothetical protein
VFLQRTTTTRRYNPPSWSAHVATSFQPAPASWSSAGWLLTVNLRSFPPCFNQGRPSRPPGPWRKPRDSNSVLLLLAPASWSSAGWLLTVNLRSFPQCFDQGRPPGPWRKPRDSNSVLLLLHPSPPPYSPPRSRLMVLGIRPLRPNPLCKSRILWLGQLYPFARTIVYLTPVN